MNECHPLALCKRLRDDGQYQTQTTAPRRSVASVLEMPTNTPQIGPSMDDELGAESQVPRQSRRR